MVNSERIASVEELTPFQDEYVYDLIMADHHPYFFANDILVHNSVYFTMAGLVNNVDDAVACADSVVDQVNESFKAFMRVAFFCQPGFDDKIKAVREIVAPAGILRAKKKYIMFVADSEGKRIDPNDDKKNLKTQGSDIKLSSTPEEIRGFLKDITMMVLKGAPKSAVSEHVIEFRRKLNANGISNALDYAAVMSVNKLTEKYAAWERIEKPGLGKVNLSANVRASINHNECLKMFNLTDEQPIISGAKIKLIWLKPNEHGFTNMAFSSDVDRLPDWFTSRFEVDVALTERKLVDQKLGNIFEPIGWEIPTEHTVRVNKLLSFD